MGIWSQDPQFAVGRGRKGAELILLGQGGPGAGIGDVDRSLRGRRRQHGHQTGHSTSLFLCDLIHEVRRRGLDGGGHERGMRSGTLNVPGIVGFGKACEIARLEMAEESVRLQKMRDRLEEALLQLEESYLNGNKTHRLPHTSNISFKYVEGEGLMMGIKDIAVSSGSACTSASLEPSYVLKSLGLDDELAHSSLRFGLGRFTTDEEIDYAIECTKKAVNKLRDMSPLWEMFKDGIDLDAVEWAEH